MKPAGAEGRVQVLAEEVEAKPAPLVGQLGRRALPGALEIGLGSPELAKNFERHDGDTLHGGVRIVKHDADLGDTMESHAATLAPRPRPVDALRGGPLPGNPPGPAGGRPAARPGGGWRLSGPRPPPPPPTPTGGGRRFA